MLGLIESLI